MNANAHTTNAERAGRWLGRVWRVFAQQIAVAWAAQRGSTDDGNDYSFMTLDELRNTPGYDPNLYNDTSHEWYEDD
jgi:hypothetical protein